jgi:hypothetical protein
VGTSRCDVPCGKAAGIIAPALRARTAQRAVPTEIGHCRQAVALDKETGFPNPEMHIALTVATMTEIEPGVANERTFNNSLG